MVRFCHAQEQAVRQNTSGSDVFLTSRHEPFASSTTCFESSIMGGHAGSDVVTDYDGDLVGGLVGFAPDELASQLASTPATDDGVGLRGNRDLDLRVTGEQSTTP